MKRRQYITPTLQLILLQHQSPLLNVSGIIDSLDDTNPEGFTLDPDDLDEDDLLR